MLVVMKDPTIQKAINIDKGVVVKDSVLTFQHRISNYPHELISLLPAI